MISKVGGGYDGGGSTRGYLDDLQAVMRCCRACWLSRGSLAMFWISLYPFSILALRSRYILKITGYLSLSWSR